MPRKYSSLCFWLCDLNWTRTNQYNSLRDHNKASPRPHNRHWTLRNHGETEDHFTHHYHYDMIHYVTVPQRNYRTRCITFTDQSIPNHTIPSRDDKARHITMRNRRETKRNHTAPYFTTPILTTTVLYSTLPYHYHPYQTSLYLNMMQDNRTLRHHNFPRPHLTLPKPIDTGQ